MDATINEHHIVSTFFKEFVKQHVLDQHVPHTIIPDSYDDDHAPDVGDIDMTSTTTTPTIQIWGFQWQLHHASLWASRPLADYFNSNLMVSNFFVADFTNDSANMFFYDERAWGKDVDALCNLRFMYHIFQ